MRRMIVPKAAFRVLTSVCVVLAIETVGWSQSLTWLRTTTQSFAHDVSNNGIVVGEIFESVYPKAFRWQNGTMQLLPGLSDRTSKALAITPDGTIVVGISQVLSGGYYPRAARWSGNGVENLGTLQGGRSSEAHDVSANGSVVVGISDGRAVRWTSSGIQLISSSTSLARAVSADGSVVVGYVMMNQQSRAFLWNLNGNITQNLGTLGGRSHSEAWGVSPDGTVVVGLCFNNNNRQPIAFRWTQEEGMINLGTLPDHTESWARDVAADGTVVGASSDGLQQQRAVRWTRSGEIEDLNMVYQDLIQGSGILLDASGISPNGRYIVGWGQRRGGPLFEAFLLDTGERPCTPHNGDVNNDGCVDDADLLAVLFAFGSTGDQLDRVDVNCDEVVDDADLLQVLFNFGSGC